MKVKARIKTSPCPFCGGEVNITHGMICAPFWFFKCKKCGAVISFDNDECNYNPEKAVESLLRKALQCFLFGGDMQGN